MNKKKKFKKTKDDKGGRDGLRNIFQLDIYHTVNETGDEHLIKHILELPILYSVQSSYRQFIYYNCKLNSIQPLIYYLNCYLIS